MNRRALLLGLLLAGCGGDERPEFPANAAGNYRLDYSGVYGVGQVDLQLLAGKVSGFNLQGAGPSYRGFYRGDGRMVTLDLIAHLPPAQQTVGGVVVTSTARDVMVQFSFPADLATGARWPIKIETQEGPITGTLSRLP
jgi:hypothetical protein